MSNAITIARVSSPPRSAPPAETKPLTPVEQKLVGVKAQDGLIMYDFRPGANPRFTYGGVDKPMMGIAKNDLKGAIEDWGGKALDAISGQENTKSIPVKDAGPLAEYDHDGDGNISREEAGVALLAMTSSQLSTMSPVMKSRGTLEPSHLSAAGTEDNVGLAKSMFDALFPDTDSGHRCRC